MPASRYVRYSFGALGPIRLGSPARTVQLVMERPARRTCSWYGGKQRRAPVRRPWLIIRNELRTNTRSYERDDELLRTALKLQL